MTEPHPITRALLTAIAHSTQPMVVTDPREPDHPMIAVNDAFERLTGYGQADTFGRNCRFLQGPETSLETTARIRRCLDEQRGCIEWIVNHRRDGSRFWNLVFISPVFAPDGTLLHFFGNQRDITQGLPSGLPDYTVGRADMPLQGQTEFHRLLGEILAAAANDDPEHAARELERIIEATRRLNDLTVNLAPPPWSPPAARPRSA